MRQFYLYCPAVRVPRHSWIVYPSSFVLNNSMRFINFSERNDLVEKKRVHKLAYAQYVRVNFANFWKVGWPIHRVLQKHKFNLFLSSQKEVLFLDLHRIHLHVRYSLSWQSKRVCCELRILFMCKSEYKFTSTSTCIIRVRSLPRIISITHRLETVLSARLLGLWASVPMTKHVDLVKVEEETHRNLCYVLCGWAHQMPLYKVSYSWINCTPSSSMCAKAYRDPQPQYMTVCMFCIFFIRNVSRILLLGINNSSGVNLISRSIIA